MSTMYFHNIHACTMNMYRTHPPMQTYNVHTHTHTGHIHAHAQTHTHTHTHTHAYMHTHTCMYMHTHTHLQSLENCFLVLLHSLPRELGDSKMAEGLQRKVAHVGLLVGEVATQQVAGPHL